MRQLESGDRVRVDIPDEDDPDFVHHRVRGEVVDLLTDDAGEETGDPRDSTLYRVRLDSGAMVDLRWRDLRPVGDD